MIKKQSSSSIWFSSCDSGAPPLQLVALNSPAAAPDHQAAVKSQVQPINLHFICSFNLNHQSCSEGLALTGGGNTVRLPVVQSKAPTAVDAQSEALWNKRRLPDVLLKPVEEAPRWLDSLQPQLTFSLHQRSWRRLLGNKTSAPLGCLLPLQSGSSQRQPFSGFLSLSFSYFSSSSRSCLS